MTERLPEAGQMAGDDWVPGLSRRRCMSCGSMETQIELIGSDARYRGLRCKRCRDFRWLKPGE